MENLLQTDGGFEKSMKLQTPLSAPQSCPFVCLCFPIVTIPTESRNTNCPTFAQWILG
jgi:hypothetical protein